MVIHFGNVSQQFLIALAKCHEFAGLDIGDDHLRQEMEELFGELVVFLLLTVSRKT